MAVRIKLRRDIATNWEQVNPVLLEGEVGIEIDTGRVKIGDGTTAWNDLDYVLGEKVPKGIDFENLAYSLKLDPTLTIRDNKLAVNVDNSTYVEGTALTWNPNTDSFVYKPVSGSGSDMFKNLIINGDFTVWQRGKTFTINATSIYTADRWQVSVLGQPGSLVSTCDSFGDSSAVLLYQFDGNANDTCGSYNGTWSGNESYNTGQFGQAAQFDGSSYVGTPVLTSAVNSTHSITVSLWVNPGASGHGCVFTEANGTWHCSWIEVETDLSVYMRVWQLNTLNLGQIPANEWSHIILSYDSNAGILYGYLNGVLVAQESGTRQVPWENGADEQFWIGKGDTTNMGDGSNFTGLIDQVRVIKRAITAAEAQLLYKETKTQGELSVVKGELSNIQNTSSTCDVFGDSSCVATYPFEGNSNDLCGIYNGTWSGNEQYDTGKFGQAAKFDGSSYIKVSNADEALRITGDLTISAWVYATSAPSSSMDILTCSSYGESLETNMLYQVAFASDMHVFFFQEYGSGTNVSYDFTYKMPLNEWHHIVVVRDDATKSLYLYVDGIFKEKGTYSNSAEKATSGNTQYLCIAGNPSGGTTPNNLFNGLIDQIRIFNRVLTPQEITTIYSEQKYTVLSSTGITIRLTNSPDYANEVVKPLIYRFEGSQLCEQATNGKKVVLSFDFKSTQAGSYTVALINKTDSSNMQSYIREFTYSNANTVQRYQLVFDLASFTSPVNNDNNLGFELVFFAMTDDADLQGQADTILTGERITTSDTVRLVQDDQIWVNRIQLEEGETATDFVSLPTQITHLMCRRYYQIKPDSSLQTLFPAMRLDNPTIAGGGPYYFDAEL